MQYRLQKACNKNAYISHLCLKLLVVNIKSHPTSSNNLTPHPAIISYHIMQ